MSVTLFGSNGFLGSSIAAELDKRNIPWVGINRSKSEKKNIFSIVQNDEEELINILNKNPKVINASGSLKPKDFEEHKTKSLEELWNNINLISKLLIKSNTKSFVQLSSAGTIYGEIDPSHSSSELDEPNPISCYGNAKFIEEIHYRKLCSMINSNYKCVRVTNPYGNKNKSTHGFIDVLLNKINDDESFLYYKDCNPKRDFVFAPDMSSMIIDILNSDEVGNFNLGSGESIHLQSIIDFINEIKPNNNYKILKKLERPSYDIVNSQIDITRIKNLGLYKSNESVYSYICKKLKV